MTSKILISIAIAASSLLVQAGPAVSKERPIVSCIDSNDDGIIALSEIARLRAWRFDRLDINNDGVLSKREFAWRRLEVLHDLMVARDAASAEDVAKGHIGLALLGCESVGQH